MTIIAEVHLEVLITVILVISGLQVGYSFAVLSFRIYHGFMLPLI